VPCYSPLEAWRGKVQVSGKRSIVFKRAQAELPTPQPLPCGQCIGCRLERSRQWAIRCVHESKMHDNNCFITLTYDDQSLPPNGTLVKKHFQDFMKRLRFRYGKGIRFYACGEYGDRFGRPHYHSAIFGFDFPDKKPLSTSEGKKLWTSQSLSELWPYGYSSIGVLNFESAAYIARYITKKLTGNKKIIYDIDMRMPEFSLMSRRPGIGLTFFEKYKDDIYPNDFLINAGKKMKPPRFYDCAYEVTHLDEMSKLKALRTEKAKSKYNGLTNQAIWENFKKSARVQLSKMSLKRRR